MSDKRLHTKAELKKLFTNLRRKGITDDMITILVDVLWRSKPSLRTSGFYWPGAPDMLIEWDNSTRTLTLSPRPPDDPEAEGADEYEPHFRFYSWAGEPVFHRHYAYDPESGDPNPDEVQIPDEEGLYAIYFDLDQETNKQALTYAKNPQWDDIAVIYLTKVIVAWIYWDYYGKQVIYYGDERHGSEWIPSIHWWAHEAFNAIRDFGLRATDIVIGDGSLNIHARVGISPGAAWHEELKHESEGVASDEGLPIFYRTAFGPRITYKSGFPVTGIHMGRIYYNNGGSLTEAYEGRFVLCHLFWTNCFLNPLIAVMGQAQYDDVIEAIDSCKDELESLDDWLPHQTRLHITTLIYETSIKYTNSVRARIVGEMTPESIADIVSEDNIPSLKTGWHPEVLEHIKFMYDEPEHSLILDLIEDAITYYFVKGIKYKVANNLLFIGLTETLGMLYIDGDGNSWGSGQDKWDEWETARVKAVALYRNVRLSQTPYLGWRMHNWEIEGRTRGNIIQETGLEHLSGLELSINETNLHEIDVTDGSLRLADIIAEIVHNSGKTFGQFLRSLRARRHWLKTYTDNTDPENPVITHEWEYQDTPAANVAALSVNNEVVVNELLEDAWQLTETTDGDYTAMWLIGTLDYAHPLKWITGTKYSSDLDEAKKINDPASLLSVIEAAQFITDHYEVIARVMIKNITDSPFYELIEIKQYEDGEFEKEISDRHVIDMDFDEVTRQLTLKRNDNLPDLTVEIPGGEQVQSDWEEADTESPAFIKNKPEGSDLYSWFLHASEQIVYLNDPDNIQVNVIGDGEIDESFPEGIFIITALNDEGETIGTESPAFNIYNNTPFTEGSIVFTWDAVEGATKYRVYFLEDDWFWEIEENTFDLYSLFLSEPQEGLPPEENTATKAQVPFEINNGDTVDFNGDGIDVETEVDDEDSTLKRVRLTKQQSDWEEEVETSPNFIKNKPVINYTNKDWTIIIAKDIEAGTVQEYIIVLKVRQGETLTIRSLVHECDVGSLINCAVKINGVSITGLNNFTITSFETETNASANNVATEGQRITLHTSSSYSGEPSLINIQLNFDR